MIVFTVTKDPHDPDMYHFRTEGRNAKKEPISFHCFATHTDYVDDDIKKLVDRDGSAPVHMEVNDDHLG